MKIIREPWPTRRRLKRRVLRCLGGVTVLGLAAVGCTHVYDLLWPSRSYAAQTITLDEAEAILADGQADDKLHRAALGAAYVWCKRSIVMLGAELDGHDPFAKILIARLAKQFHDTVNH